jgi:DNA-binding transcriptional LysR family regulator
MNDHRQDLVNEGVDVALRFGALTDSNAMARRLGASPRLLAASPAYLAGAGSPDTPGSLANHAVIVGPLGVGPDGWSFQRDGLTTSLRVEGRLTTSVNEAATAIAGLGIVSTGLWNCRPELASGALVHVLADWQMKPIELHAMFAAGRTAKPSARAFADYLAGALRE